ncbi:MAG TPA: pilus assembly protein N-terminal domain-containing protein [Phycisphaerae bacterium]|nr:hypothetical protein [Phycisphaerae bacterium]HOB75037.1 pilus assembly protein N-terminal domain-containing protein [Phycisphaerae bacterium]HOJ54828.1 pilus assembly protein N-terminal domain-containing protein [Phycisphaerae bacterium]HOL26894.1 pilus assembly protein N-terminal domain-containing protein [Phycisphaerae bacterium]HPP20849.1 pilus assembly protein N-terminal domain-containing protein [Phycisphaerae bacterium]
MKRFALPAICLLALGVDLLQAERPAEATAPAAGSNAGLTIQANVREITATTPSQKIELFAGHGILIDVNRPVRRAAIGGEGIAEVSVLSPRQIMLSGKTLGTTNLILWDEDDNQVIYNITVQPDLGPLRDAIATAAPGAQVEVIPMGSKIVLRGSVPDVDTCEHILKLAEAFADTLPAAPAGSNGSAGHTSASSGQSGSSQAGAATTSGASTRRQTNIVNQLVVAGEHQVVLRCTVAEVTKTAIRQLGINGWLAGDNIRDVFAVNQIAGINPVNIGAAAGQNVIRPGGLTFATGEMGLSATPELSLGFPRVQMQLFFKALRQNNLLRVLAEPNLVALSGQEASFLAGGEFASVTTSINGTEIEWKEFGIRLRFTPTVIGRQLIRLRVAPEVSDLDPSRAVITPQIQIPGGLITRRAETTIELASGSTIAIAGLLNERARGIAQKVPALGDVPVLGALFSSVEFQKEMTELVVLVTPELVSALQPDQVDPVPGQSMRDPNDWELFGLGMLEGQPVCEPDNPAGALETKAAPRYPKLSSPPEQMTLHGPWGPADRAEAMQ